jgi:asparagine synthase (glutamine-hydrolysing)
MCGFLLSVAPQPVPAQQFQAALDSIQHRGPDAEGIWSSGGLRMGHRRLAIIDLSRDGNQPMIDADNGVVITFNGEIYNYIELRETLRARGHVFRTQSDTEVLLKAWAEWRFDMASHLNGMWAFAIWEPNTRTLFASRDRFGVKPLYYATVGDHICMASEPKALITLEPTLAEVNTTALYDLFMSSRGILGAQTFYRNVKSLSPGHNLIGTLNDNGKLQMDAPRCYWSYPEPEDITVSTADSAQQFEALFEDAVKLRLRSDVPVGITLSGGIDSTAVLAASARSSANKLNCFTSVYSATERGEENWAKLAAGVEGNPLFSIVAGYDNWIETLKSIVWHLDGPSQSSAVFPHWTVAKAARAQNVPVLLEGQGADELLAGYAQYMPYQSRRLLKNIALGRSNIADMKTHLASANATFGFTSSALWHLRSLSEPTYKWMQAAFGHGKLFASGTMPSRGYDMPPPKTQRRRGSVYTKLLSDHMRDSLPSLLQYGDAMTMAHGIENRLPFMDYRLVEWVFRSQPPLIVEGDTKWPVRQYLKKRGYNDIAARRDKQGYPTPVIQWLRSGESYVRDDILNRSTAKIWQFFDRKVVTKSFESAIAGNKASAFHFYKIVPTHLWLEQLGNNIKR